jgi:hypothetical protein
MKKVIYLMLIAALAFSCEEDIDDNTPAFQSVIDGEFFRASNLTVTSGENGVWLITGTATVQEIVLQISGLETGIYQLGQNLINVATYTVEGGEIYATGETGGDVGEVVISDYNASEGYISGVFKFTAQANPSGSVNIQEGIFYRVPIQ